MTFIEFKKQLLDAEISLPKFSKLIKVSEKNIQSYKKRAGVAKKLKVMIHQILRNKTWLYYPSSQPSPPQGEGTKRSGFDFYN